MVRKKYYFNSVNSSNKNAGSLSNAWVIILIGNGHSILTVGFVYVHKTKILIEFLNIKP